MTEHERAVSAFKEYLPAKSLRSDFPQILWIQAPMHDGFTNNNLRYKFNKCLEDCVKSHSSTWTLALKKSWDPKDADLYISDCGRFTTSGFKTYWEAVDRTTCYFDSILLKKQEKRKNLKIHGNKMDQKDCFRW